MWATHLFVWIKWCVQEGQWILYWWYLLAVDFSFFASAMLTILNNDTFKVHQISFLFVCLGFLFHARTFISYGDDIITDKGQHTLNINRHLWLSRVMTVLARAMPAATLVIFANSRPQGCCVWKFMFVDLDLPLP